MEIRQAELQSQPVVYDANNPGLSALARQVQQYQRLSNLNALNVLGNDNAPNRKERYVLGKHSGWPTYPLIMADRHVPRAMFERDIADLRATYMDFYRYYNKLCCLDFLTCRFIECFYENPNTRVKRQFEEKIAEMNPRYLPYHFQWALEVVPEVAFSLTLET